MIECITFETALLKPQPLSRVCSYRTTIPKAVAKLLHLDKCKSVKWTARPDGDRTVIVVEGGATDAAPGPEPPPDDAGGASVPTEPAGAPEPEQPLKEPVKKPAANVPFAANAGPTEKQVDKRQMRINMTSKIFSRKCGLDQWPEAVAEAAILEEEGVLDREVAKLHPAVRPRFQSAWARRGEYLKMSAKLMFDTTGDRIWLVCPKCGKVTSAPKPGEQVVQNATGGSRILLLAATIDCSNVSCRNQMDLRMREYLDPSGHLVSKYPASFDVTKYMAAQQAKEQVTPA